MKCKRSLLRLGPIVALLATGAAATWYFAFREGEPKNDLERFQGEWQVSRDGKETPNVIRVSGDNWEYVGGKAYRMTLNESAKEIDLELIDASGLVGAPVKMHGNYAFVGNKTVRVKIGPALEPRPFLEESDGGVLVLTKVKLEPDALQK